MKKLFIPFFITCLFSFLYPSCNEDIEEPIIYHWPNSNHTLLIYMIGDNTLSSFCKDNTNACIDGLLRTETPLNLFIFEDSYNSGHKGNPVLFQLVRDSIDIQKIDTIVIEEFENTTQSIDPNFMRYIINKTFDYSPTPIKGIEIWSHGLGWTPSSKYIVSNDSGQHIESRSTQWVGQDDNNYIEIWDLREVLEKCPHFNYIAFDACNMAQAEVAYELRNIADYMIACPSEIMAEGLPYTGMIKVLSQCNESQEIPFYLTKVVDEFALLYPGKKKHEGNTLDGGTISVTNLNMMTPLHHLYKILLSDSQNQIKQLCDTSNLKNICQYGRMVTQSQNLFFDIEDVARFINDNKYNSNEAYTYFTEIFNQTIIKEYHSSQILEIDCTKANGLSVSIPELLGDSTLLSFAYKELQWSKD